MGRFRSRDLATASRPPARLARWARRAPALTVAVALVLLLPLAGLAVGQAPRAYSVQVLAIEQSPNLTAQSTMTISMHVASTASIKFVFFAFCQLTSPVCYAPVVMNAQASNWFVGTTQPMSNYSGMTPGVHAGYNITIQFIDNSTFMEPHLPNAFSNLTIVSSVSGEYMFEVTVRPQVFDLGGVVTDSATGAGISGATVSLVPGGNSTVTGATGAYAFASLFNGTYTVSVTHIGYTSTSASVVVAGQSQVKNFVLTNPNAPSKTSSSGGRSGLSALLSGPTLYVIVGISILAVALLTAWATRWRKSEPRTVVAPTPDPAEPPPKGSG